MKILAIGAHPDDIEIFMFGFLAACKQRGAAREFIGTRTLSLRSRGVHRCHLQAGLREPIPQEAYRKSFVIIRHLTCDDGQEHQAPRGARASRK